MSHGGRRTRRRRGRGLWVEDEGHKTEPVEIKRDDEEEKRQRNVLTSLTR